MLHRFVNDWRFRTVLIAGGWGFWWILSFVQNYFLVEGDDLRENIVRFTVVGGVWALATPLVLVFARWIKYDNRFMRLILLHLLGATAILFIRSVPQTAIVRAIYYPEMPFVDFWLAGVPNLIVGNYIIYGFIASFHYSAAWFAEYKDTEVKHLSLRLRSEQLERQLSEANLTTLRMQLNPHFLFNTLNSVASLIRIGRSHEAIDTLSTLSDFLRFTVHEGMKNEVTIREEIGFIKRYLTIEELRFSDRLEVFWDVEESVLDSRVPTFLLQPLVENALKHGLKEARNGKLFISIKATEDGRIVFLIEDNGLGLPGGSIPERTAGVGLKNTVNRLQRTYPDLFEFSLSNNGSASGAVVKLVVPLSM